MGLRADYETNMQFFNIVAIYLFQLQ